MVKKQSFIIGLLYWWLVPPFVLWPYVFMILSLIFEHNFKTIPMAIISSYFMYCIISPALNIVIIKEDHIRVIGEANPFPFVKRQYGFHVSLISIKKIEIRKVLRDINSKKEMLSYRAFFVSFDAILLITNNGEVYRLFLNSFTKKQKKSIVNTLIAFNPQITVEDKRDDNDFSNFL